MDIKKSATGIAFRILRLVGILAVIYVSMVFYLALTERRNAFPRAITHKEAREAIANSAKSITCTTKDGITLEGWTIGNSVAPLLLYYPDANEDAAQFLAEAQGQKGFSLAAFNYRGSGSNKGTPSQEAFEADAKDIAECAAQIGGKSPEFLAGRGTGAILAAEQFNGNGNLLLIDPAMSIADAIGAKYRFLYPKFLVRADVKMPTEKLEKFGKRTTILLDRSFSRDANHTFKSRFGGLNSLERGEKSFAEILLYWITQSY
ncbi:alpha/beta hydrolase [Fibrobacter sp. UBA2449]|uniref:alpha/beta hydrolase n=1 Tax=Fibrobacter sp. UBA2449 TaxID=1946529 RepID=UPI0025BA54C9|nr:alpha/beta hydrolase [Fibrobacter sp. UBA2449]